MADLTFPRRPDLERAVRAWPFDDAPRLGYADWLADHDTPVACPVCVGRGGHVVVEGGWARPEPGASTAVARANFDAVAAAVLEWPRAVLAWAACPECEGRGRAAGPSGTWAEFIRVQIEMADQRRKVPVPSPANDRRQDWLVRREQVLFTRLAPVVAALVGALPVPACSLLPDEAVDAPAGVWKLTWERGFPGEAVVPPPDVIDSPVVPASLVALCGLFPVTRLRANWLPARYYRRRAAAPLWGWLPPGLAHAPLGADLSPRLCRIILDAVRVDPRVGLPPLYADPD